jgi:hypothetical protein
MQVYPLSDPQKGTIVMSINHLTQDEHREVSDYMKALRAGLLHPLLVEDFTKSSPPAMRRETAYNNLQTLRTKLSELCFMHAGGPRDYDPYYDNDQLPPSHLLVVGGTGGEVAQHLYERYQSAHERIDGRVPAAVAKLAAKLKGQLHGLMKMHEESDRWR